MAKNAVEQTGLIPRSIIRTFDRFRKQLFPEAENLIIQEFRISRYQFLVSIKCFASLILIPLIVNFLLKNFLLIPLTETFWNNKQSEIFLNSYQQEQAFNELKKFQEKLYFEYLLNNQISFPFQLQKNNFQQSFENCFQSFAENNFLNEKFFEQIEQNKQNFCPSLNNNQLKNSFYLKTSVNDSCLQFLFENNSKYFEKTIPIVHLLPEVKQLNKKQLSCNLLKLSSTKKNYWIVKNSLRSSFAQQQLSEDTIKTLIKNKIVELAVYYNHQSILALTNLVGDFITFLIVSLVIIYMKPQISILKSFLTESIYSLNDTKKSFLLILGTDLLVGFHSPRGWEICLELILRHFGFPENKDFVFLFVASFPVLLDTVFKYWIFRYLNKISPSTVATYHNMIE